MESRQIKPTSVKKIANVSEKQKVCECRNFSFFPLSRWKITKGFPEGVKRVRGGFARSVLLAGSRYSLLPVYNAF